MFLEQAADIVHKVDINIIGFPFDHILQHINSITKP